MCFDEEIRRSLDQGRLIGAVMLDLRKVFDLEVLCKMRDLVVLDGKLESVRKYLQNHIQIVELWGSCVAESLPQGSILGPLLFIFHLNDLPSAVVESSILMWYFSLILKYQLWRLPVRKVNLALGRVKAHRTRNSRHTRL